MTRLIVIFGLSLFSGFAMAQTGQNLGAKIGMGSGGLIVGAEYEVVDTITESFVGFLTIHSKDSDKGAPGLLSLGGAFKLRVVHDAYEVYFAPGFGIINYDSGVEEDLLLGPRLAIGMHAKLDQYLAVGVENEKLYSWLGEVEGPITDSFLLTFQFAM